MVDIIGRALLVDDESDIREIVSLSLSSLGIEIVEAGDGKKALEILETQHFDLVCTDIMMPRMTGINFLEEIRQRGIFLPVIFLTGYPSQESTLQALRLGAFDFIEKPFEPERLKKLVKEALRISKEMQKSGSLRTNRGRLTSTIDLDYGAMQLQKLKTLRFKNEDSTVDNQDDGLAKLRDMFVSEVTPQLLFSQAAIRSLHVPENRAFELGYLFRVMQTIGEAAEAIGAGKIAEIARSTEYFYTTLRVASWDISDAIISLAAEVNNTLLESINSLDSTGDATVDVSATVIALKQASEAIEAKSITRASVG